jgi:hypothetical protein
MNLLNCFGFFFLLFRFCFSVNFLAGNEEILKFIFQNHSNLVILSCDQENRENLITSLQDIFPFFSYVILGFSNYEKWLENCQRFNDDKSLRISYYERFYQKYFSKTQNQQNVMSSMENKSTLASSSVDSYESFIDSLDRWYKFRLSMFVFVSNLDEFEWKMCCLVNRGGTFLVIIEQRTSYEKNLLSIKFSMRKLWKTTPNLRIFILFGHEIYIFNPFKIDEFDKYYGVLEVCEEKCSYISYRKFDGYPMNVEVFDSAYSIPKNDEGNSFNGSLNNFYGPDINVAYFLQQQLNVSSN